MESTEGTPGFPTMMMRRFARQKLISESIAMKIARMVVIEECGEAALEAQLPLTLAGEDEHWLARGHRSDSLKALALQSPIIVGPLRMRISQYDGQIVDLHYEPFNSLT